VAETLATFLGEITADDLPGVALEHAAMLIASTLASAAAGARIDSARITREIARDRGGRADASIWFDPGPKLPIADAAQANAVASAASASDDSDLRNIVHMGTPLTAAAVAIAESTGASGDEITTAMVCGYEAAGRISEAITPGARIRGFHGSVAAIFSATVASGRLLDLTVPQLTHAIALSATSIGGLLAAAHVSTAREYHDGLAVLLGVGATVAAGRGYLANPAIFEAKRGYFEAFSGVEGQQAAEVALADLGESWDIVTDMGVKLMPGAHRLHSYAEAAAKAATAGDIGPDEVDTITISSPGLTSLEEPKHPVDLVDMAHSGTYFAAAGAADRSLTWAHASQAKITDPVIHRLIDRVRVGDQPRSDLDRYRIGATVTIRALDGRTSSETVFVPRGTAESGLTWADIDAKYRALLPEAGVDSSSVEISLALLHTLREGSAVSEITAMLRSPAD
jgi:2-methylcitrate dehydratase PrpD